jgi:hypothetical protein
MLLRCVWTVRGDRLRRSPISSPLPVREDLDEGSRVGSPGNPRGLEGLGEVDAALRDGLEGVPQDLDRVRVLVDEPVDPRLLHPEERVVVAVRGEHQDAKVRDRLQDPVRDVEAVHVRQRQVEDDGVGLVLEDQGDRLDPGVGLAHDRIAKFRAADFSYNVPDHQMVFDDYDLHAGDAMVGWN